MEQEGGQVAEALWAGERGGGEVREVHRAPCTLGQGKGSASGFFPARSQSLKRERWTTQSRGCEIGNEFGT